MSETLAIIKQLVRQKKVRLSDHGHEELRADGLRLSHILESVTSAEVVEDYPDAFKGATVLALHFVHDKSIHVVWGLAKANPDVATLVTAYSPDPNKWYDGFKQRRPK